MSAIPIISYIALGLIPLGLIWIFSSIGKGKVEVKNSIMLEEDCETTLKEKTIDAFVVLNKIRYRKINFIWYQVTPSGKLMSLIHLENYQQIFQLLEEKAKEQVC